MTERSSIFDMIGPIMIGPSSSHTAGVVRIGRAARHALGQPVVSAVITFYNSFAATYEGHGSDRAVLAGLMDFPTDDERLRNAPEIAKEVGLTYSYRSVMSASKLHPNSLRIQCTAADGTTAEVLGVSRGGGLVSIVEVDGFHANFTTQLDTIVVKADDTKGSIAFIASICSHDNSNIATMTVGRKAKNNLACLILEVDSPLSQLSLDYMRSLWWVKSVTKLPPLS